GNVPAAVVAMQRAVDLGLPPIRFVAGKETLLDPLKGTAEFKKLAAPFDHKIVAGPMLGVVTDTSAKVWVRTAKPAKVQVSYRPMNTKARSQLAASVQSKLEDDCVAVVTLENLRAGETYHYDVVVDGAIDPVLAASQQFTTAPKDGSRAKFSVAFGGCAGYTPANERMWDTIRGFNLSALWLLGDNVYSDAPEWPAIQNYCFYRRQARPEFRRLTASTPTYAIYDDHDFGANDCSGGPEIEKPAWKRQVWNLFRNTWLNPSYGGGEKQPGCWFDYQYGDVHFIFLDGRYYRANEKHAVNPPTMLGPVQKEWLLKTIGESKSKIKVLISPVTWALGTKGESPDTWHGYQEERQEIMDFLAEKKISGVVLVSSDRHRTDLLRNDRKNGYPIFEFNSGLLTNDSAHPRLATAEFSYNDLPTFGMIDFDTVSPEASVTYRIIDILGREHLKFTVFESELK
ncbi:MAG: alkaline phosphatase D family protein, partial [Planctomycetota bacterium]|nr:alkaline phosphatase D family protein [Planctomycetota bacterium]